MPANKPDSAHPVDNPVALIRSRIKEHRIFEARFLCRQLSADLGGSEKNALIRELAQLQARVEKLLQQARACVAMEEYILAEQLYRDIEQIAIDVPGLAEEKKALEGAAALVAKIACKAAIQEPEIFPQASAPVDLETFDQPGAATRYRLKRWRRRPWLMFSLFGLGLLVLLLFSLRHRFDGKPLPATPKSSLTQPAQKIFIKPLAPLPVAAVDQPDREAGHSDPPAGTTLPPSTSVQVGALQIKQSLRE